MSASTPTTNTTKHLNLIYLISFLDIFSIGLTFPLFATHLKNLGVSHVAIGIISSLYAGLQIVSGPITGSWSDVRDRKSVLIITLAICSLAYIALGLTNSISVIIVIRVVLGTMKHTQTITKAMITDILPINKRAGAFGRSSAYGSIGFIVGPLLGGHLSEHKDGFFYVCLLTGLVFIIIIVLASALPIVKAPERAKTRQNIYQRTKGELVKSITDLAEIDWTKLWPTFLLRFLFGLSVTMYFSQQSLYLQEHFNLSQRHIGYTISYYSTIGTVAAFLQQTITSHFYPKDESCQQRMRHFFVIMTASTILLYLAPNIQIFLVVMVPFSISCTVVRIASMELMLKEADLNQRGSLSGASNSIMSIARFITPVTNGVLTDAFGGHMVMLFNAVPPLVGFLVVSSVKLTKKQ